MRMTTLVRRNVRIAGKLARGLWDTDHPILAQIVVVRRCNLACSYCFEYDRTSRPVPLGNALKRLDALADLGTAMVTITGGEPLLHPDLETLIAHVRKRGMLVTAITNGFLLTPERIRRMNAAGLDHLQMSIDNVEPDEVSKKSLRLLEPKLRWLAELADFTVTINSVVGGGIRHPEDALVVARRTRELGMMSSLAIIHDAQGQRKPLPARELAIYEQMKAAGGRAITKVNDTFQDNLARGRPNDWRCRAGARYLYIDEDGLVHYCAQQLGFPGIPVERYTREDIRRAFRSAKACAPYCSLNCVHQASLLDGWRGRQTL